MEKQPKKIRFECRPKMLVDGKIITKGKKPVIIEIERGKKAKIIDSAGESKEVLKMLKSHIDNTRIKRLYP